MIDCDDYDSLSDDDVVEMTPKVSKPEEPTNHERTNHIRSTDAIETIVIDEDLDQPSTDTKKNHFKFFIQTMKRIQQENSAFALFLDTCLNLENSDGMMRIIERTLIKHYEQCDSDFKKSPQFRRCINKTICLLESDPEHKFSHIKNLVHSMNAKKVKKRVELVTLATNLKGNHTRGLISKSKQRNTKTINNNDSIVIDSDDEHPDIPTINIDDTPNEIICLDGLESEKENHRTENDLSNSQEKLLVPQAVLYESRQETLTYIEPKVVPIEYEPICNVPESNVCETQPNIQVLGRVQELERRIEYLKSQITVLDEMEVENDSVASPYVLCEGYKAEVVQIYKEICRLIGEQPVKKRKVRLKVLEGHPLGPVKRLEMFINNNIGDDGLPMFPDYSEVLKCVMVANLEDKMGWKKQQIMREANALFTQCGKALQQKRQKREYRNLMSRLKTELRDPADDDPVLMRRLEQNRRTAIKKELDLMERYAQLQDLPQRSRSGSTFEQLSPTNLQPSNSNYVNQNGYHKTQTDTRYGPCSSTYVREHNIVRQTQNHLDLSGIHEDVVMERTNIQMEPTNVQIQQTSNIEPEYTCNSNLSGIHKDVMEPIGIQMEPTNVQMEPTNIQVEQTSNIKPEYTCKSNLLSGIHKDVVMEPLSTLIDPTNVQMEPKNIQIEQTSNIEPEYTCNSNVSGIHKDVVMEPISTQIEPTNVQMEPTSDIKPEYTYNSNISGIDKDVVMESISTRIEPTNVQREPTNVQMEPTSNKKPEYNLNGIHKDVVMEPISTQIEPTNVQMEPSNGQIEPTLDIKPEYNCNSNLSGIQKDVVMEPISTQIEPTNVQMEPANVQIEPTSDIKPEYNCNCNLSGIHKDVVMEPVSTLIDPTNVQMEPTNIQIEQTSNIKPEYTCNSNLSGIHKDVMEPICSSNIQTEPLSNIESKNTCNGNADDNESCGSIDECPSPCCDIILSDEDSNFEPPDIPLSFEIKEHFDTDAPETENQDNVKKEIKNEPIDIIKMLEDIGDDYTTSVIDIEDPFLVIEISDSSDSDDDEEI